MEVTSRVALRALRSRGVGRAAGAFVRGLAGSGAGATVVDAVGAWLSGADAARDINYSVAADGYREVSAHFIDREFGVQASGVAADKPLLLPPPPKIMQIEPGNVISPEIFALAAHVQPALPVVSRGMLDLDAGYGAAAGGGAVSAEERGVEEGGPEPEGVEAAAGKSARGKHVLSLGGTGFLGKKLISRLIESEDVDKVVMVVKPGERLPFKSDKIEYVERDLRESSIRGERGASFWRGVIESHDIDVVQHAAGIAAAPHDDIFAVNTDSVTGLIAGIKATGRDDIRFVYVSSGDVERTKIVQGVTGEADPYGGSKIQAEEALQSSGVRFHIMRPDYILPEVDRESGAIEDAHNPHMHNFVALPDGFPVFLPDGAEELTFNPVSSRDTADALTRVTLDDSFDGRVMDACGEQEVTLREMLGYLAGVQGKKMPPIIPLDIEPTAKFAGAVNKGAFCESLTLAAKVPAAQRRSGKKLAFKPEELGELITDRPRERLADVYATESGRPLRFSAPDVVGVAGGMLQHPVTVGAAVARLATSCTVWRGLGNAAMSTLGRRDLPPRSRMLVDEVEQLRARRAERYATSASAESASSLSEDTRRPSATERLEEERVASSDISEGRV